MRFIRWDLPHLGFILGVHTRQLEFVKNSGTMLRRGLAGEFVSIYLHEGQRAVHIVTDGGCLYRPLIIVDEETGLPKLKQIHIEGLATGTLNIRDVLRHGIVEYIDCLEESNTLIAMTERDLVKGRRKAAPGKMKYTHLEIAGLVLFSHNQSPRNTHQCAMGNKQWEPCR